MNTYEKLSILSDAAKYDVACTSSGSNRQAVKGKLGSTSVGGICHSFSADGRCISLLKVLYSNACSYDCEYCANRKSAHTKRASFTPRELANLTIEFYRRNFIEGLFLSSGVLVSPDNTTEQIIECIRILREEYHFNGYIHAKAIPGTSPELVERLGFLVDRMSVNIELPSQKSLSLLAPDKSKQSVTKPMSYIRDAIDTENTALALRAKSNLAKRSKQRKFVPAGQSTQMIIGATPENDTHILKFSKSLYKAYGLKRIFFSAYIPVNESSKLPDKLSFSSPLTREHRLYQADWLMRFYDFDADELLPDTGYLDLDHDPKVVWALKHLDDFPIEITTAPLSTLLRIPGIGPRGARKIIRARKYSALSEESLKKLGIVLKRAKYFITINGKYISPYKFDPEIISKQILSDSLNTKANLKRKMQENQLTLF